MVKNKCLLIISVLFLSAALSSCGNVNGINEAPPEISGLEFTERVQLQYANQFTIDRYDDGYTLISTSGGDEYMIVPESNEIPAGLSEDIKIIHTPANNIYLAATATMGFFDALGEGNAVRFSGTKAEDWYIDYAKEAMQKGEMLYAGKYREPDFELLLSENCKLSIQSTMILHSPDVREKLEELGITVFTDYSSYEQNPLGRSEWIKVYGEITGKQDEAEKLFREQSEYISTIDPQSTGKTAVFFYINSAGQAVTRKSGDYVTKMIEMAGGDNVFKNLGEGQSSSSVTMETEDFYSAAKDADFIIYNSTIGGEISSISDMISRNALLADFKAVKESNVWCTHNNLYQEAMKTGAIIADFNAVFTDETDKRPPQFLYKLGE